MSLTPDGKRFGLSVAKVALTLLNARIVDSNDPSNSQGFRSVPKGSTWLLLATEASANTLFESVDKGQTWTVSTLTSGASASLPLVHLAFRASDGAPVFMTTAGGTSGTPGPNTGTWTAGRAAWFKAAGLAVCAGINGATQRLVTTDGTAAIVDHSSDVPSAMLAGATEFFIAQSTTTLIVAANKVSTAGGAQILATTDGLTYSEETSPVAPGYRLSQLSWDPGASAFVACTTDGANTSVNVSADGSSWTEAMHFAGVFDVGEAQDGNASFSVQAPSTVLL